MRHTASWGSDVGLASDLSIPMTFPGAAVDLEEGALAESWTPWLPDCCLYIDRMEKRGTWSGGESFTQVTLFSKP